MARNKFGGDMSAWAFSRNDQQLANLVQLQPGVVVTFWDAPTGGNQYTDLLVNGSPAASVTTSTGADGRERGALPVFEGPDDDTVLSMWAEVQGATARYLIHSNDITTYINSVRGAVAAHAASIADLDQRVTELEQAPGGGAGGALVPMVTVGPAGSGADHETDGTADQVQILAAIASLSGGGEVRLLPGTYNLAAPITISGTDTYDGPTIILSGSGMHTTKLVAASGVDAISLTNAASVVIRDMEIAVAGSGSGIVSTSAAGDLYQAFWNSEFRNLYFRRNGPGSHTGWAMNLGSPFRSRFVNIEVFDLHNGIRLYSESADFNPGDCSFDRVFIELDSTTGSVGLHLESVTGMGSLNQCTFNMCEFFDNAAGGTAVLLSGTGGGGSNHNMFTGINIEQFTTCVNVAAGISNTFDLNYVESRPGGSFFVMGSGAKANHIRRCGFVAVLNKVNTVINDTGSDANAPNTFENLYIGLDPGGNAQATVQAATRILGTRGYPPGGTLAPALAFGRYPYAVPYLHNGSSYVVAPGAGIYVGPTDPGAVPDGSVWYDTSGA
ncbi:MAG: hypothetical protein DIU79_14465 [Actinobacteria bacterium]|nr:MAG: hypothetical protein DIU79_14465 [Actinomycetota bacterium]